MKRTLTLIAATVLTLICGCPISWAGPSPYPPDASLEIDAGKPGELVEVMFSDSGADDEQQNVTVRSAAFEPDDVVLGFTGRKYIGSARLRRTLKPGRFIASVQSLTHGRKASMEAEVKVLPSAQPLNDSARRVSPRHGFLEGAVAGICAGAVVTLAALYAVHRLRRRRPS
ncbi:hypothetical protein SMC26_10880 [Actinomadura fulvescens]|uniref:Lipoprotein n=1 Tax=Actinomadura fulvescens TaxID=46160 RepID=A0ABP6CC40_9ACTN